MKPLTLAKTILRPLKRALVGKPNSAGHEQDSETAGKVAYAKGVLSNGVKPTDFSIGLGAAPCNHTCLFCPQSVEKPNRAVWLDLDLLRKVLEELPEEKLRLNISSYSETVAAANLLPSVRLMKEVRPKLPVIMASNGTLFREEVIEGLIDAGLDHYSYSFDAANRRDYAAMMQHDDFDKVWRNLDRLVELRNRKKSRM